MNYFNEMEDTFLFKLSDGIFDTDKEIFSVGREIKKRLGEDGYLVDNYIAMLLESIHGNSIQNAAGDGEDAFSRAYRLCTQIHEGEDMLNPNIQKKLLYPELKKYIDIYSTKHKSRYTVLAMAIIAVAPIVMKKVYAEGMFVYSSRGHIDSVKLREIYDEICRHAGNILPDRLNELIKTRFLIAPALNAYMQAATDHYLYSWLQRDEVSSKQIFQLILDDEPVE